MDSMYRYSSTERPAKTNRRAYFGGSERLLKLKFTIGSRAFPHVADSTFRA